MLIEILRPVGVLARNIPRVRQLEGLEQKIEVLHGDVPERLIVREGAIEYEIDPWHGQKTGLFLDQRENRIAAAAAHARGRALDCFSYHGGFALRSRGGARTSWRWTSRKTRSRGLRRTRLVTV